MDGFDSYATSNDLFQEYPLMNCALNLGSGRCGGASLTPQSYAGGLGWVYPTGLTEIWAGMGFAGIAGQLTDMPIFSIGSTLGIEAEVTLNGSSAVWSLYNGNQVYTGSPQMQGNVTYPVSSNGWHWVDIHYKIGGSGILEIWVDGTRILNLPSANTTQYGSTVFTTVIFGGDLESSSVINNIDDVYILDTTGEYNNSRLGTVRIESLVPASDAGPNDGYPSTSGSHYLMVNEPQWSSSNIIRLGNTVGNEELFGMTSLVNTPDTIYAIKVTGVLEKTNPQAVSANAIISSSGVVNNGNSTTLLTSYAHVNNIFESDPNTSNTWTYTSINSLNCGIVIS